MRSAYTNKMNEVKPHRAWAERTMLRAEVFGVATEDIVVRDVAGQSRHSCKSWKRLVKRGIETGHLREIAEALVQPFEQQNFLGQMLWIERSQAP